MNINLMFLPYITFFFLIQVTFSVANNITVNQNITDGETIVSRNDKYELGFFSPGSSSNRYFGIWFKNTTPRTVVWVANRERPINNTLGVVKLDNQGIVSLVDGGGILIWSSNVSASSRNVNRIAQLMDNGNFVIQDDEYNVIWQSFDYPGDTFLSGMKVGKNLVTGREMYLTSWRSADDPSPGEYTMKLLMVEGKYIQEYVARNNVRQARIGPFNGIQFAGLPVYTANPFFAYKFEVIANQNEMYFMITFNSTTYSFRCRITPEGRFEILHLNMESQRWNQVGLFPMDNCDAYGLCGPFGSCSTRTYPNCGCLTGFERNNLPQQSPDNWTSGCRRSIDLDCGPEEGFFKFSSMKLPDTQNAVYNGSINIQECEAACKKNCSCTAYANPNISAGAVGCLLWYGELIDTRVYPQNGQDLYVRLAASELSGLRSGGNGKKQVALIVSLSISAGLIFLALITALYIWCKKKRSNAQKAGKAVNIVDNDHTSSSKNISIEVPVFSLSRISRATNNFSIDNMLGEGGFGPVYKGKLEGGQEIAVKRLSKSSRQGLHEFENEVICIAKLQHRNLVKLLGYCIQEDETMLIYEYMPNKSLDWFIFDDSRTSLLDWPQRFHIIQGIARGLLYLHQDSRLRVIHRDLKAGNILLDQDMNPKISDFGLARMFKEHESEGNTKRVVGTLGYLSPEYAVNGLFSVKSDIFSFGVLVLEIVSGKKNRGFVDEDHHDDNLLGHAWRLHQEGKSLDLIDTSLGKSYSVYEVLRSIHIGLLCVQQRAEDRPSTASVVSMLGGEGSLPSPKLPGFFIQGGENVSTSGRLLPSSINGITISVVQGR